MKALLFTILAAAMGSLPGRAQAQTSYPFIFSLYPAGLQRGTTAEVTLTGLHNYHGAYRALVEGAGVSAEIIPPEGGWPPKDAKTGALPVLNELKLKVTAAPDAWFGPRELRVATPRGVSSAGILVIGDEPESLEKEPNNSPEQAQAVPIPTTINGRIQQGEDVDTYRITAAAGDQVTFAVTCARLQDKIHDLQQHADPLLTLRDAAGRELVSNDDYYRADPLLSYRFEKAGDYFLQIRDVSYLGNPYWVYRLTITKRPYVTAALPAAVRPGAPAKLHAVGFNMGGAPEAEAEIPADMPMGERLVQLRTAAGTTNPVPLVVTDLPDAQPDPRRVTDAGQELPLPCAASGRLEKPGERHRFRFKASKGQMFQFEAAARQLDSRMDPELALYNASGGLLALNDDAVGLDPRLDWTAPEDGEYVLEIRDVERQGGDNHAYLLTARIAGPDFSLRCDDDKMKLSPGGSGAWYILVDRRFGFNAEIKIDVKGLPPGVTAAPLTIPPNLPQGCLILTCAPDAKMDVSQVEVIGTASVTGADGKPITLTRRATPLQEIYIPGGGRGLYAMQTQAVAVVEQADIQLTLSTTSITLQPGGTAKIDVEVKRAPGYTKPVTLDVYLRHLGTVYGNPLPPGVSLDEGASKTLLGENETKGHIVLKASPDAPPIASQPIAILGAVSINFVVKVSYAGPPVLLTVEKKP